MLLSRLNLATASSLLFLLPFGLTQSLAKAQAPCGNLAPLQSIAQDAVTSLNLPGASLQVKQHGQSLFQQTYGNYDLQRTVAIASATKWLSAAVLMSLVDDDLVSLDDKVGTYIPSFIGSKANITLRQCFSHTSGLAEDDPSLSNRFITLAQAVENISLTPLIATPGTAFAYGGVSMHVAGRVCEIAGGKPWATLFQERIATPLGLTDTHYYAFGITLNPRIAGGARSSLGDYMKFLEMLRNGGMHGNTQVLTAQSVAEMFRDQTSGLTVIATPHPNGAPYGIGTWLDQQDGQGRPLLVSGAGAFGFTGWIDLQRNASACLLVFNTFPQVWPFVEQMQEVTTTALQPQGIICAGAFTPACNGDIWMNGNGLPRSGNTDFALFATAAPANAQGFLVVAPGTDPIGTPLLGAQIHLPLNIPPILFGVQSDNSGTVVTPVPLAGVPVGLHAGAQYLWLNPAGCGQGDSLSASQAVEIFAQLP